jgi:hypothetical protein
MTDMHSAPLSPRAWAFMCKNCGCGIVTEADKAPVTHDPTKCAKQEYDPRVSVIQLRALHLWEPQTPAN